MPRTYNELDSLIGKLNKNCPKIKKVNNITQLTTSVINKLKAGDIVAKKTGNQYHSYIVSYKENGQGICLTYTDASIVETVSYDYIDGAWVYNSTDITPIMEPLLENIIDHNGNKRFVEGEGSPSLISGVTPLYNKWSLSGTHLMLVYTFKIDANTPNINSFTTLVGYNLPEWLTNKILPVFSDLIINFKSEYIKNYLTTGFSTTQFSLSKSNNRILIQTLDTLEMSTVDRVCRIQFDLLIDTSN